MNKIIAKENFSNKVVSLEIEAPLIARSRKAGHFVMVRVGKKGERVPYTIASADPVKGTITLVIQRVGKSSEKVCQLEPGTTSPIWSAHWAKPHISRISAPFFVQVAVWGLLHCFR